MIRRDVLTQPGNRTVKWSLIAAAVALSLGLYAEHSLTAQGEKAATAVMVKAAPAPVSAIISD